jgi:hypothetical protein
MQQKKNGKNNNKNDVVEESTAIKIRNNLWIEEDLERKSITDLFVELRKLNLSSLIGLILVEQFIGGISILFYLKYFAQLTGEFHA